jgi:hypothetical protein
MLNGGLIKRPLEWVGVPGQDRSSYRNRDDFHAPPRRLRPPQPQRHVRLMAQEQKAGFSLDPPDFRQIRRI